MAIREGMPESSLLLMVTSLPWKFTFGSLNTDCRVKRYLPCPRVCLQSSKTQLPEQTVSLPGPSLAPSSLSILPFQLPGLRSRCMKVRFYILSYSNTGKRGVRGKTFQVYHLNKECILQLLRNRSSLQTVWKISSPIQCLLNLHRNVL